MTPPLTSQIVLLIFKLMCGTWPKGSKTLTSSQLIVDTDSFLYMCWYKLHLYILDVLGVKENLKSLLNLILDFYPYTELCKGFISPHGQVKISKSQSQL